MENKNRNLAYIDGSNLHNGIQSLSWDFDYGRFRIWLSDKYKVSQAYLFLGLIPKHKELYKYLQECGFILTYKQVSYDDVGTVKGNCDAILVLNAVCDFYEKKCDKAVIVSSDGDYAELVEFLKIKGALLSVVSPSNKCSYLLRRQNTSLLYLDTQRKKLEHK